MRKKDIKLLIDSFGLHANSIIDIFWHHSLINGKDILILNKQLEEIRETLKIIESFKFRKNYLE